MPHIIIKYSNNLTDINITDLIHDCHHAMDGHHKVTNDHVKTRAIKLDDFWVGVHRAQGQMIHITLKLMTGRSIRATNPG
jgi:5-carboxymethyl-2-hydroxymuconate isomerase